MFNCRLLNSVIFLASTHSQLLVDHISLCPKTSNSFIEFLQFINHFQVKLCCFPTLTCPSYAILDHLRVALLILEVPIYLITS